MDFICRASTIGNSGKIFLFVFIPLLSLCMHWHVVKLDLIGFHVWRQTETQTVIDNFYKEDFNIFHPRINSRGDGNGIFRMEFPIMQWLFACFYKIFGNHIIISRILTFIIGLFSVWGMYRLISYIFHNERIGLIGAWCFSFSPVFYYYTMNPMPDNFALCTAIWGITFFFEWTALKKYTLLLWSGLFLSLATLAKLPFIVYLLPIAVYLIRGLFIKREINLKKTVAVLLILMACFAAPAIWYLNVVGAWQGNGVVHGILSVTGKDIPMLLDILQGVLISSLPELLINYGSLLFFLAGFWFLIRNKSYRNSQFIILASWGIGVLTYFFFEMNMIGTMHDYYLFPFLPLVFAIVAFGAWQLLNVNSKAIKVISVIALCILPVTAFLRMDHRWNTIDPGFDNALLKYKNELKNAVPDSALCIVGNDESTYIFFYYIDKKGWTFNDDMLSAKDMESMINRGAKYLYSDSRKLERDALINAHFDKLIMQKDSINVYKLK